MFRGWYFPQKGARNILGVVFILFFYMKKKGCYKIPNSEMGGHKFIVNDHGAYK